MSAVSYTHEDGIATITIDFPPQNRLGPDVSAGLTPAIMDLAQRNDTRALLFKTIGPDFSWGGDFRTWKGPTHEEFGQNMAQAIAATNMLEKFPFPVVVAVQGFCGGGGFEMALRGDIIIASDDAEFSHTEASIGVFTFLGGVQRVADRIGRTRAAQWAFTAERIGAAEAIQIGLINEVVPREELYDAADAWVQRLAKGATLAHAAHKKLLRAWSDGGIEAADKLMPQMAAEIHASRDLQDNLDAAIEAWAAGEPRPDFNFKGE